MNSNISVVIPTFNDAEFLSRALASISKQSYKPSEIIVVDDGSFDNKAELVVTNLPDTFPICTTYLWKENNGASSARNYGIKKAKGEYIAFLDADDEWLPNHLEVKVSKIIAAGSNCFGVYSGFVCSPSDVKSKFSSVNGVTCPDLIGKPLGFPGGAPSYLFKRGPLLEVNGFDTSLKQNEDFDLILRLIKTGYTFSGNNETTFIRHLRDDSLTRNRNYYRSYKRVNEFLYKAWKQEYLSKVEIIRRACFNFLALVRKSLMLK